MFQSKMNVSPSKYVGGNMERGRANMSIEYGYTFIEAKKKKNGCYLSYEYNIEQCLSFFYFYYNLVVVFTSYSLIVSIYR